jgi:hypothetical protein
MALYIVLENKNPGFDPFVNGKALGQADEQLAEMAKLCGVHPLMDFFSMNPDDASDFLDSEGLADMELPQEQWFSAQEGIRTVQALLRTIENVPELTDVKADLLELQAVLIKAHERGIRWHLAVDV